MKPGMSSLNPYAAPFIPLSRQRTDSKNIAPTTSEDSKIYDPTACYNQVTESKTGDAKITFGDSILSDENPQHHLPNHATLNMNGCSIEGPTDSRVSLWKDCNARNYEDSMPQKADDMADTQSLIEDYELDLAYLAAAFPSISEQSLVDVYCANSGDLEASVDMLIQLEVLFNAPTAVCFLLFLHLSLRMVMDKLLYVGGICQWWLTGNTAKLSTNLIVGIMNQWMSVYMLYYPVSFILKFIYGFIYLGFTSLDLSDWLCRSFIYNIRPKISHSFHGLETIKKHLSLINPNSGGCRTEALAYGWA